MVEVRYVRITRNLCVEIIGRERIHSIRVLLLRDAPNFPLEEEYFRYYLEGKGDPSIGIDNLDLSRLNDPTLKILLTLKRDVPFGNVITYGELASITGTHPRAVGLAMKLNPFPLIIPCHRVVGRKGIGGYSMGIEIKRELLKHEGIIL